MEYILYIHFKKSFSHESVAWSSREPQLYYLKESEDGIELVEKKIKNE